MSKIKNKVYCQGCKYLEVGYCYHPTNTKQKDSPKRPYLSHKTISDANLLNDCKLREEGLSIFSIQLIQVIGFVMISMLVLYCFVGGR